MKFRKDFVTNSSSSSFICEVCGEAQSGFNISPFEVGIAECYSNHYICYDHIDSNYPIEYIREEIIKDYKRKRIKRKIPEDLRKKINECECIEEICGLYDLEIEYIPESICPICNFKEISDYDLERYKNYLLGKSNEELKKEIKNKFSSYKELKKIFKKGVDRK